MKTTDSELQEVDSYLARALQAVQSGRAILRNATGSWARPAPGWAEEDARLARVLRALEGVRRRIDDQISRPNGKSAGSWGSGRPNTEGDRSPIPPGYG